MNFPRGVCPQTPLQAVNATMPALFKSAYPNTRVIVGATEIFIEQPSSPEAQQTL